MNAARCLLAASGAITADPIGILVPVGGALVLQAFGLVAARAVWEQGLGPWAAALAGSTAAAFVGGAFLRSRWIAVAARNAGWSAAPWGRPLALLGVQLVVAPLAALALAAPAIPLGAIGLWLASRGWLAVGGVLGAVGLCAGSLASTAVRSVFSLAAPEVVVGGRSALDGLAIAARRGGRELLPLAALVIAGDLATALGGLTCGAGALPGYPLTDLALLHRWAGGSR